MISESSFFFFTYVPTSPFAPHPAEPTPPIDSPSPHFAPQSTQLTSAPFSPGAIVFLTVDKVTNPLRAPHSGKAVGPDGVRPGVVKTCAPQSCGVLHWLFNLSLRLQRVPVMWKTSCLVTIPKIPHPRNMKDSRPVAWPAHSWAHSSLPTSPTWVTKPSLSSC